MTTPTLNSITNAIKTSFIRFDHVNTLLERMGDIYTTNRDNAEAENLFIIGESGVGKSRLLEKFVSNYPRKIHAEFTEIPVLYVKVPSTGSIDNLLGAILNSMGSPFWDKGKIASRTAQLLSLLNSCKVQMVILDEANHLIDKGGSITHHKIADWLKSLTDDAKIPFILCGIPRSLKLLDKNDQLRSRFRQVITIRPFSMETPETQKQFYSALKTFSKLLMEVSCIDLTSEETAKALIYATAGRLRDIRRLLVRSVELGFKNTKKKITYLELSKAFAEVIFANAPKGRNPFEKGFEAYPLIKPGEPFAPREE